MAPYVRQDIINKRLNYCFSTDQTYVKRLSAHEKFALELDKLDEAISQFLMLFSFADREDSALLEEAKTLKNKHDIELSKLTKEIKKAHQKITARYSCHLRLAGAS